MGTNAKAWNGIVSLAIIMGAILFISAGTFLYWQGWIYLALFIGTSSLITRYLAAHDPALLARRIGAGPAAEKERSQKIITSLAGLGFVVLLMVPALDLRYGWSTIPLSAVIAGYVLVAIGFYVVFLTFRENTFASATIEIEKGQLIVATGPYAVIRHPMYAGGLILLAGTPLALGSYWGFIPFAAMTPFLLWRLFDEERLLARKLPGYAEYEKKVRSRLIPWIF